ncbi:conserved membrane hypothetical protein [Candidatus Desulfarcum epimagneticum]|uniref:Hemolysin n=1 Tax=uncultured Desulfobacteraceae bacterium TaxID=218296 RepID=A0A484HFB9_9BACT|nr:conserved membrane hypothetical protein [uncultured Desulfobacteraceae bacterium]
MVLETPALIKISVIVILLAVSGFFSGSESAFFSLSFIQREKLKNKPGGRARLAARLLENPRRLIIAILMGNDLVNIAASVVATYLFVSLMGDLGKWAAIAVMAPLTLVFSEVIPKTVSMRQNERMALFAAGPIAFFSALVKPVRWLFDAAAEGLIRLMGIGKKRRAPSIRESDFLDMVDLSHEGGQITETAKDLIHNVFEFGDVRAGRVMTPAEKIFSLPHDMEIGKAAEAILKNPFSRAPVHASHPGDITGILYAKDLLKVDMENARKKKLPIRVLKRSPYFVREDARAEALFDAMRKERIHMAFCLDASGELSGLVTLEDLLEELFGEIYDEYDRPRAPGPDGKEATPCPRD